MNSIEQNLKLVRENAAQAAQKYHRDPNAITLVAVSKNHSIAAIKTAAQCGQKNFGENRVQEAIPKIEALKTYNLVWHYIGRIQSNKAKLIARNFDWVHSVARLDIAELLNAYRPVDLPPLNICIQTNLDAEPSKDGIAIADLAPLVHAIVKLPHLKLCGLMTIPAPSKNFDHQFETFKKLADAAKNLAPNPPLQLSMGMSDDYVAAIAAGATIIRIGTAIFGTR